jgi:tryptophanyl-tRNA synthetase
MMTPLSWLERVPTYKEKLQNAVADLGSYGFLGYPLLMTADIILYKAHKVPVGEDQLFHIELAREVLRRFHFLYQREVFPEPDAVLTKTPKVPGLDGRKMSKSYGNTIDLGEAAESTQKKIMGMVTDPARKRRQDPGNPDVCGVFYLHKVTSDPETVAWVDTNCRTAGIGCVDCKKKLLERLGPSQEAIRERREALLARPGDLDEIVRIGTERARTAAARTMEEVRAVMKL